MLGAERKYAGLMLMLMSLLISLSIGASIYYFKTKHNEQVQNQLHYSELSLLSNDINNSIGQIIRLAKINHDLLKEECEKVKETKTTIKASCIQIAPTDNAQSLNDEPIQTTPEKLRQSLLDIARESPTLKNLRITNRCVSSAPKLTDPIAAKFYSEQPEYRLIENKDSLDALISEHSLQINFFCLTMHIPLSDLISVPLKKFSFVILVDEQGEVLSLERNDKTDAYQHNLNLSNVANLFSDNSSGYSGDKEESNPKHELHNASSGRVQQPYSTFTERNVGGKDFRIYISPISIPLTFSSEPEITKDFMLLGFRPAADISMAKLHISPDIIKSLVIGLVIFLVSLPLIKLRFVSHKYCFRKSDAWAIAVGFLLLISFASIYFVQLLYQSEIETRLAKNAAYTHERIANSLIKEIDEATTLAFAVEPFINAKIEIENPVIGLEPESDLGSADLAKKVKIAELAKSFPHMESVFKIEEDGEISNRIYRTDEKFARLSRPNLKGREYFNKIVQDEGWKMPESSKYPKKSFYIQRIFNMADSRKSSQFAWKIEESEESKGSDNDYKVLSAAVILQSLQKAVLPRNMQYVIFEPDTGSVLYASNDEISLVENFYIATGNSKQMGQVIATQFTNYPDDDHFWRPTTKQNLFHFNGSYHDNNVRFFVGSLDPKIPWAMAIIYYQDEVKLLSLIASLAAMSLVTLTLLTGAFVVMVSFRLLPWQNMLIYRKYKTNIYSKFSLFVMILVAIQLSVIYIIPNVLLHFIFGALNLALIKRMAGTYLLPNRRVKRWSFWLIASLYGLTFLIFILDLDNPFALLSISVWLQVVLLIMPLVLMYLFNILYKKFFIKQGVRHVKKDTNGYSCYLLTILLAISLVPAVATQTSVHAYLLDKLAEIEQIDVQSRVEKRQAQIKSYHKYINHEKNYDAINSQELLNICGLTAQDSPFWLYRSKTEQPIPEGGRQVRHIWVERDFNFIGQTAVLNKQKNELSAIECNTPATSSEAGNFPPYKSTDVQIDSQEIFHQALLNHWVAIILVLVLSFIVLFYLCKTMLSQRLLGVDMSDDFRVNSYHKNAEADINRLVRALAEPRNAQYGMILRPVRQNMREVLARFEDRKILGQVLDLHALLMTDTELLNLGAAESHSANSHDSALEILDTYSQQQMNLLQLKLAVKEQVAKKDVLFIKNLGAIAFDAEYRKLALQFLEFAMTLEHLSIVIFADVSPLYKLTRQYAYPLVSKRDIATPNERTLWSNLFARFSKYYDWNPLQELPALMRPDINSVLHRETSCWPEMHRIRDEFLSFHFFQRLNKQQRDKIYIGSNPAMTEGEIAQLKAADDTFYSQLSDETMTTIYQSAAFKLSIDKSWTEKQLLEFIHEHAGAIFRYRWEQCTKSERLLLFNLATDHLANPLGYGPLSHLIRRGYIIKDTVWSINSRSFQQFILSAESASLFKQWLDESEDSPWRYVKIPIFTAILVIVGVVVYSATESIESILGLMTAFITIMPLLIKNISAVKGAPQQPAEPPVESE